MRVYLLHSGKKEEGPMSIEDVRDRLDLRMITPDQPCRIAGLEGTYVAGELVTGHLFKGWEPEEDVDTGNPDWPGEEIPPDPDDLEEDDSDDDGEFDDETSDDEEDEESHEDEEDEEDEAWDDIPLWVGKPGYTAFLPRVGVTGVLAAGCGVTLWFALPAWLSLVLAALACLSLALLLGRRSGTRYRLYERRLEWQEPGFLTRTRELPRVNVDAIEIKRPWPGGLLGRADILFHHHHPKLPSPVVFRQVARAREARSHWR